MKTFNIVYQTTNLVNGMVYVGKHTTDNLNDGYMGSGKHLTRAIKKYGKENFLVEHLYFAFSEDAAYEFEAQIVDEAFVTSPLTYNMMLGGLGAPNGINHHMYGKTHTDEAKAAMSLRMSTNNPFKGKTHTDESRAKISAARSGSVMMNRRGDNHHMKGKPGPFKGRTHTDEVKAKASTSQEKYVYTIVKPDGTIDTARSLNKYCKENGLNQGAMSTMKKHKGYQVILKELIEKGA